MEKDNPAVVDGVENEDEEYDDDIGVPLIVVDSLAPAASSTVAVNRTEQQKLQSSQQGCLETAILDCFALAVRTHDHDANESSTNASEMDWMPPSSLKETSRTIRDSTGNDLSFLKTWTPKPLTLPNWAAVPYIAEQTQSSNGNGEGGEKDCRKS